MDDLELVADGDRTLVPVRAVPRAKHTAVEGVHDGALKVRLAATPVDGAANDALVRFLAKRVFGVPRSAVTVVRGQTGRDKLIAVAGRSPDEVRAALRDA